VVTANEGQQLNSRTEAAGATRIGLGLAALGRPAYISAGRATDLPPGRSVEAMCVRAGEVLDAAYALGVRYVDVARSYGLAEQFLRTWLDAHPEASDVEVGSKWGYRYVGEWAIDADVHEVKDHSLSALTEQLAATRATLGDRLDVYHIHSATLESGVLRDRAVIGALAALRDSGIRVGLSTSGPRQSETVREALTVRPGGQPLFTSVQATWNLLEPSAGPALAEASQAGAQVIVKEVLANGRLAPGAVSDDAPAVHRVAQELAVSVDQVAIAAALRQPWVWRVLSGAATTAQVRSNLAAAELTLPDTVTGELAAAAVDAVRYWSERARRPWL
jgi:aryl-alcohol dehydrogenase-like predicted oxidoreductase